MGSETSIIHGNFFIHAAEEKIKESITMLILLDEDPYYFNSTPLSKIYIIYFIDVTPMSAFGNPDALSLLLGLWHFRNCSKITVQFSRLNSITRRDFYGFLQKRKTASSSCSRAEQVQSAGWGHLWGNCSQEAPFGFCSPTGIFLWSRKILCFPQL